MSQTPSYISKITENENVTELRIVIPPAILVIQVRSPGAMALRRHIASTAYRALFGLFRFFRSAEIVHSDEYGVNAFRTEERGFRREMKPWRFPNVREERQRLGCWIRTRRLELGLSQTDCARRAGIDRSNLSVIERGRCKPSPLTLSKLEPVLKYPLSRIVELDPWKDLNEAEPDDPQFEPLPSPTAPNNRRAFTDPT